MHTTRSYLDHLRQYGHVPRLVGTCKIGRKRYTAGMFTTPEHDPPSGSRLAAEGGKVPAEDRFVLIPVDGGELLPASYRRSGRTIYRDRHDQTYYVAGWAPPGTIAADGLPHGAVYVKSAAWMDGAPDPDEYRFGPRPVKEITWEWTDVLS